MPAYKAIGTAVEGTLGWGTGPYTLTLTSPSTTAVGDLVVVWTIAFTTASLSTISATYDGSSMTMVNATPSRWGSYYLVGFSRVATSAGAKSISLSMTASYGYGGMYGVPVVYSDASSVVLLGQATGSTSVPSHTVSSSSGKLVTQAFGRSSPDGTGYTQTQRFSGSQSAWGGYAVSLNVGEAAGAASVTFGMSNATTSAWGSLVIEIAAGSPAQTVSPTGIASGEAIGAATVSVGAVQVSPTGIPSAEAFGTASISVAGGLQSLAPSGIDTAEAFGTPTVALASFPQTVTATGIGSGEFFGTPVMVGGNALGRMLARLRAGLNSTVLFEGDSTIAGVGDETYGGGYPPWFGRIIGQALNVNVVYQGYNLGGSWNAGGTLWTSTLGVAAPTLTVQNGGAGLTTIANHEGYINSAMLSAGSALDAIFIGLGINDMSIGGLSATTYPPAMITFVSHMRAKAPNASIIVTNQNVSGGTWDAGYDNLFTALVGSTSPLSPPIRPATSDYPLVWAMDTHQAFSYSADIMFDGMHPRLAGYIRMAQWIVSTIDPGVLQVTRLPSAITSGETFGSTIVSQGQVYVAPSGIASAETFGSATASPGPVSISLTGLPSAGAFGSALVSAGALALAPSGVPSAEAFGSATVAAGPVSISPNSIPSVEVIGSATVSAPSVSTIDPSGIPSAEMLGNPTVAYTSSIDIRVSKERMFTIAAENRIYRILKPRQ